MTANFDLFHIRLKQIIREESNNSFAKKCELPESLLRKYLAGTSLPGTKALVAISEYANVNLEWLATGNGPMLKTDAMSAPAAISQPLADSPITNFTVTDFLGRQLDFKPDPNLIHIPVLSLEAACGMGTFADESYITAMFSATREWLALNLRRNPDNLYLIRARGDSMTDTIKPDDMVFVDPSEARQPSDGIWVFAYEDSLFIKRLQFLPGRQIKVTSDNPRYEPYLLSPDTSFRLLARYIATLNVKI